MAKGPNLGQINSPVFTVSQLNQAYSKIDSAFDNTLSRDGSTPNTMLADLDMNSNDVLNVGNLQSSTIVVSEATIGGKLFSGTIEWRGDWVTATSYLKLDVVRKDGNLYICLEEHTSDVFATDLAGFRWEVFISNTIGPAGTPGVGVPIGGTTGQVLAKASNTNYDTVWTAAGGGGSPAGSSGEVQYNNAGVFAGAADVEIEGGQLRLPAIATPTTPASGGVKLYGTDYLGPMRLGFLGPDGKVRMIQNELGEFSVQRFQPAVGLNTAVGENSLNLTLLGTGTAAGAAITNLHTMKPRLDVLVTTASTTAIAGIRPNGSGPRPVRVGRDANAPGGFLARFVWAPATGVSNASHRAFCGLDGTTNVPTDVENSGLTTGIVGMGWDAADANIQIMHNDLSGAATKIDLGASFPVPTVDRGEVYELQLFSPNSLTQSVSYRVIRYATTDNTIAAEATGTITTNLPPVGTLLGPHIRMSVGGTSSVVGIACMGILIGREY